MKIKTLLVLFFLKSIFLQAQIVVNELDADNPSTDDHEFVELKSSTPYFPLNGYVIVFYSGTNTGLVKTSYKAIDLDGYTTDVNGIIHFGNAAVSPSPAGTFPANTIYNNPSGVAVYLGNATDFPTGTAATSTNLIDALCYTNSTTVQPTAIMSALGLSTSVYDNQSTYTATKSIQRKNDGTYEIKTPTPGMNNDGSGVVLNYLTMSTTVTSITEGQDLTITFTASQAVTGTAVTIDFTLDNETFNTNDYTGTPSVTIPVGATSGSTTIHIVNDGLNEGDEELKIYINPIPSGYNLYNNNVIIRVNDINFTTLPFGTPANPTHGIVTSSAPTGYYSSLEGLSGAALKQALQDIISNPSIVRVHNYDDMWELLKTADQNPENSNQVWLIYTETPRSKIDYQNGSSIVGKWNREHIYCQSRGNYAAGTDYITPNADGINLYTLTTGANDIGAGVCDAHHIRAVDGQENSSRNNRNYGVDYNGPTTTPTTTWKGDVARACFYMAVRYNGLSVVNGNPTDGTIGQIGDLATLLTWNHSDSADDFEMNRNNYIYTWQKNRNPFIDYPDLADFIFGSRVGEVWHASLANTKNPLSKAFVYPNPTKDRIYISDIQEDATATLYSLFGEKLLEKKINTNESLDLSNFSSGVYILKIVSETNFTEFKISKQ
ncbi:endonuclease [Flavobacterium aciduliphilum]|uniref:Putative secreted protein (Por secretion system target) n=1 Tax=Flavobacterium aciduliphilum TaxID=1101402 RepID=A0A328Y7J9_9FLAO|nr:endonuclease [Flavobacterium aciduliphilum]RAR70008.1 putative secreted protein (Por secretion system target) [Flavobacterium aciduliphilum]